MNKILMVGLVSTLAIAQPCFGFAQELAETTAPAAQTVSAADYVIGTGDELEIFVWKNTELNTTAPVRPDGKITAPLVQDIQAQGKTPAQLSADLTVALKKYIQDPTVTVVVKTVVDAENRASIRVIGAAVQPKTVPYRRGITALDVMINLGGLPTFAAGNRAQILRPDPAQKGGYQVIPIHLNDLVNKADVTQNVTLLPGDIIKIPERWF